MQHCVDARGDGVAALTLEALEVFAVLCQGAGRGVMGEIGGLVHQRLLQRQQLGELPRRGLPNRRRGAEVAVLLQQRHPQPGSARNAAAGGVELTREQPKEGGLSGAVAAHDAPPLDRGDGEGNVREEGGIAEIDADARKSDLSHLASRIAQNSSVV